MAADFEKLGVFYLGREFDPVKVGLDISGKSGSFLLDTTLRGNSNAGHSFENDPRGNGVIGPLLTEFRSHHPKASASLINTNPVFG